MTNKEKLDILWQRRQAAYDLYYDKLNAGVDDEKLLAAAGVQHWHFAEADVAVNVNKKDIFMNDYLPELPWIDKARSYITTKEKAGAAHNPVVLKLWNEAFKAVGQKPWINDDETPWCGGFVGGVLAECGLDKHIPKLFPRALEWAKVGTKLDSPAYGCVVVFNRKGGGHVGFCVGKNKNGDLLILGGNQSNAVNIRAFDRSRVVAYRWCGTMPYPHNDRYDLAAATDNTPTSTSEA